MKGDLKMEYNYFISYAINLDNGTLSFDNGFFPLENTIETSEDIKAIEKMITAKLKYASANFYIKVNNFILLSEKDPSEETREE